MAGIRQTHEAVKRRSYLPKIALVSASLLISFAVIEMYFRIFDYFPYFSQSEVNMTEHGNLSEYDPLLGWKDTPGEAERMTTEDNSVWLQNNSHSFRDIEHDSSSKRPAIVFLGDSFTWGYEVEFNEMFVNRLRDRLKGYEVFNLSHRGYSTDQELLTFKNFRYGGPVRLVVLMFCENDVRGNNTDYVYEKYKPKFEIVNDKLVLRGVPVPKVPEWGNTGTINPSPPASGWKERVKKMLFKSYFIHDLYFTYELNYGQSNLPIYNSPSKPGTVTTPHQNGTTKTGSDQTPDLTLTTRILGELKKNISLRGAHLVIFLIPSKLEIDHLTSAPPYQEKIEGICGQLDVACVDLAPYFKKSWKRTYFHEGVHWNKYGNGVAAGAIYKYISSNPGLLNDSGYISGDKKSPPKTVYH